MIPTSTGWQTYVLSSNSKVIPKKLNLNTFNPKQGFQLKLTVTVTQLAVNSSNHGSQSSFFTFQIQVLSHFCRKLQTGSFVEAPETKAELEHSSIHTLSNHMLTFQPDGLQSTNSHVIVIYSQKQLTLAERVTWSVSLFDKHSLNGTMTKLEVKLFLKKLFQCEGNSFLECCPPF